MSVALLGQLVADQPRYWKAAQVRRVARVLNGGTPSSDPDNWDGDIPFITPPDLRGQSGRVVVSTGRTVTTRGAAAGSTLADSGVIISNRAPIGYVGRVGAASAFNQGCKAIQPKASIAERYLAYTMLASAPLLQELGQGTTFMELSSQSLSSLQIPLPPIDEQTRIADILDRETAKIDALIEKQRALVEQLRERRWHAIAYAVTPTSVEADDLIPLKRVLRRVDQGISPDTSAGDDSAEVWVLKAGASNRGKFSEEESKPMPAHIPIPSGIEVQPGDLIASRASGSVDLVASVAMVPNLERRLILSDKNIRLVPTTSVSPRYLYWALNSPSYRSQVRLAISGADGLANNIPVSVLRRIRIWVPNREAQREIADHLDRETSKIDTLIEKAERFVGLARERRVALVTAAVTGQIDIEGAA